MMKKLVMTLLISTVSWGESSTVDISLGLGTMANNKPQASFGDSEALSMKIDLDRPKSNYMWIQFDHDIPIVPSIRIESFSMEYSGSVSSSGDFNGYTITTNGISSVDVSNIDIIAYWGLPSSWVPTIKEADVGVGIKSIDGILNIIESTINTTEDVNTLLPYGYAKLHLYPSFMAGVGLEAAIKVSSGSGIYFNENILKFDWGKADLIPAIGMELGIEAGYRTTSIRYDAEGNYSYLNFDFSGIFIGIYGKFGI